MNELLHNRSVLVLGGIRSGKSHFAETLIEESGFSPVYIATGEALDDEMRQRIDAHQRRRGRQWRTIEAPLELPRAIEASSSNDPASETATLVDCLSLWVTNLMLAEKPLKPAFDRLLSTMENRRIVFVSNEVGLGGVSMNAMARRFADECGTLHQRVAAEADAAVLVTAGLPCWLKRKPAP